MAEEVTAQFQMPEPHEVVAPENDTVEIEGVEPRLIAFAVKLGYLHWLLFGRDLVITSGRDGVHKPGSLHPEGRALDFRTHDKSEAQMVIFLTLLAYLAPLFECRVFDERVGPGGQHVHVEFHG